MSEYVYNQKNLKTLLEQKNHVALKNALSQLNEVDVADFIASLDENNRILVFSLCEKRKAAKIFADLSSESQKTLISSFTNERLAEILESIAIDDMVDMMEEMPANVVPRILQNTKNSTRRLVNKFLRYSKDSTGSIMTAEFIDLKKEYTVERAILKIKQLALEMETIYTVYVTDSERHLEGTASFKELLIAPSQAKIDSIMEKNVICVSTDTDKETAANLLNKYGFLSLPVVDSENRLVGILTADDAALVIQQETTEDFEKMAALQPSGEKPYLKTGVFSLTKNRILWLSVLMVSGMITGRILGAFEDAFVALPILVAFVPMLTGTGGNAGSQSSALIIRGLALGEIFPRDFLRIIWKELRVGAIVGTFLGAANFLRIIIFYNDQTIFVALTVSLAMVLTVILAKTIGALLPLLAKKLRVDPALMAAPLISTIVDAASLVIYFLLAKKLALA